MTSPPTLRYEKHGVEVWHGCAREVAAMQEDGSFSLAILDPPYAMGKADWDRMKVHELPAWLAPHLDDVDRLCGDDASLYVWNTAEGWATLHPGIVARGWVFRSLVVWNKVNPPSAIGKARATGPIDSTEVCGVYQRGAPPFTHWSGASVWTLPQGVIAKAQMRSGTVVPHRMTGRPVNQSLHPCEKPLAFAERMILASSRPGDRVWAPFGGTCREALACKLLNERDPANARECVTAEIDMDGRNYLDAVVRVLEGRGVKPEDPKQPDLF